MSNREAVEISENLLNIRKIDEYLLSLSVMEKKRNDTQLIYPNAWLGMTNMIINKKQALKLLVKIYFY